MFDLVTKYCLWDLTTEAVKFNDTLTSQVEYEGEQRGQTQRFMITAGDLILDLFTKIEDLFYWGDPAAASTELLFYLQRKFFARYISADGTNDPLVQEFLDEIISAWRLKGTQVFLHWMIWKIFNWQLVQVYATGNAFRLNMVASKLYDTWIAPADRKVLYDNSTMGFSGLTATLVIDVFSDSAFSEKHIVLENLLKEWGMQYGYIYLNEP